MDNKRGPKPKLKSEEPEQIPQKVKPEIRYDPAQRAIANIAPIPQSSDMAVLYNKETGKRLPMSRAQAERQQRKYPNLYDVI